MARILAAVEGRPVMGDGESIALFVASCVAITILGHSCGKDAGLDLGFRTGCLTADPTRVVMTIEGEQRCLTREQAAAVKP